MCDWESLNLAAKSPFTVDKEEPGRLEQTVYPELLATERMLASLAPQSVVNTAIRGRAMFHLKLHHYDDAQIRTATALSSSGAR